MKRSWAVGLAAIGAGALYYRRSRRRRGVWDNFSGRVALVMGGSRGLGLELARQLARDGALVSIAARDAQELAYAQENLGGGVTVLQCDVTSPDDVRRAIATVFEQKGRIDVLVNNAGVMKVGPVESMDIADFKQAMDTNYWGAVHATLYALPLMKAAGAGRIVNIASIGGVVNPPHLVPYNASKAALIGFSEGIQAELRGNVRVLTVCPGLMRTGSPMNAEFKGNADAEFVWFSLSDMLPGFSIGVENAAAKILRACRLGERALMFTVPARVGALFHAAFPGPTIALFERINRLLPASTRRASVRGGATGGAINAALKGALRRMGRRQNQAAGQA